MYLNSWWLHTYVPISNSRPGTHFAVIITLTFLERLFTRYWGVVVRIWGHSVSWTLMMSGTKIGVSVHQGVQWRWSWGFMQFFHSNHLAHVIMDISLCIGTLSHWNKFLSYSEGKFSTIVCWTMWQQFVEEPNMGVMIKSLF